MSTSIYEMLSGALGGGILSQLSRSIGADETQTGAAAAAGVSTLVEALSRNVSGAEGAAALHRAVSRDHDGSLLDNLVGFFGGAQTGPGNAILEHILGGRRRAVEAGISRTSGLDISQVSKLLALLAPMVLAALGRAQRQGKLDSGGLADLIGSERNAMVGREPGAMGMLGQMLDADRDGDVDLGDVAQRGFGMLGKLFQK